MNGVNGSLVLAFGTGGPTNEQVQDVAVSDAGDYFLTGFFSSTVDFDPGVGVYNLTATGYADVFYQQLDASGTFGQAWGFGAPFSGCVGNTIRTDAAGRITFAGAFENTVDFDPGSNTAILSSILTTSDCFVVQFNSCIPFQTTIAATICEGDSIFAGGGLPNYFGFLHRSLFQRKRLRFNCNFKPERLAGCIS
jgi:hypothetical protein